MKDLLKLFKQQAPVEHFDSIKIGLASPEMVRAWWVAYRGEGFEAPPPPDKPAVKAPLLQLGPGDSVSVQVYGQPDLSTTVYVGDDGTVSVPLAGNIQVAGLSPAQASSRIEAALKSGKILVDPHVTLTVTQTRSQRVSVLGQVGAPGRYAVESNTTIFDLLAQAGGITATGSDIVYIIRLDKDGKEVRFPVDLKRGTELFGQQAERLNEPGYREIIAACGIIVVEGFNDVMALDALGIPSVAIMSNKMTEQQAAKVERSGLQGFFEFIEIVPEKDTETYSSLVKKHKIVKSLGWMIGNSPRSDINPAMKIGLNAVYVPHQHTWQMEHEPVIAGSAPSTSGWLKM